VAVFWLSGRRVKRYGGRRSVKTEAIPNSLTPFLKTCPTGYHNACLEACARDVTTCCYYQGPNSPKPASSFQEPYFNSWKKKPTICRVCGQTDPDKFYAGHPSTCGACIQELRSANHRKKKAGQKPSFTRACRTCGIQFWSQHKEGYLDCPECRKPAVAKSRLKTIDLNDEP
jgi:hypothetical protein